MTIDNRNMGQDKKIGKDTHVHTLENVKIIGMISGHGDEKISAFLPYLLRSSGKKVIHIHPVQFQDRSQSLENLLQYHVDAEEGELEYAIVHLPCTLTNPYDLSNIYLDSVIHTCLGEHHDHSNSVFNNLSTKGYAMINVDDARHTDVTEHLENKLVITYGLSPKATITASSIEVGSNLHFTCCIQRGMTTRSGLEVDPMEFPVYIPDFGKSDIHDALAAIGAGLIYGISTEDIVKAFETHHQTSKKIKYESR